ncbi:hypothetical protein FZC79_13945 [Rossellomorea vietnamensis]|uniref:DUF2007 domain-containing protein n=2 Tax=Rossellomorea TaxID=2837508 RepID=A0A5D4KEC7_9BACI|nr:MULTISPECIES: hypothetical protein [Rossellomorea]TYR74573.1 hypothetical protein FZC79_13945 [Rossellomorea vietnamensis]TYS75136.1 hypothetical protein FZC80_18345 [Rossellomorea aquimaris]
MRKIQAYFGSETEARDARNKLKSINVEDGMLEKVPDGRSISDVAADLFSGEKHDPHILNFHVAEEDHEKAGAIVKEHNGYVR